MILECIVTTLDDQGELNIAPMGPIVDESDRQLSTFLMRPFKTSQTFKNLERSRAGVLHITDDVELLARAAISAWQTLPATGPASKIEGRILDTANRWHEFEVTEIDDRQDRSEMRCQTVARGARSDFIGLNRAKYAVLEAAILMTRLEFIPKLEIEKQLQTLEVIVNKTAGVAESRAFRLLQDYFQAHGGDGKEATKHPHGTHSDG